VRSVRSPSRIFSCVAALIVALAIGACGDDGDDDGDTGDAASAKELSGQLVPPSAVVVGTEVKLDRQFEWTDPIDFTVEGIFVPQSVSGAASNTVHALEDAGFEAGAGNVLASDDGSITVFADVVKFESEDGAAEARDALNANNLQQPCHGACAVDPKPAETLGVPDAKAVHHVPLEGAELPPTAGPPFEARVIEFTIGPYLYHLDVDGPPGAISASDWKQTVEAAYEQAKKKTPSS
jgi:hypothetical protein